MTTQIQPRNFIPHTIVGGHYYRAKGASLDNPHHGIKTVTYHLEKVIVLTDGEYEYIDAGTLVGYLSDDNAMDVVHIYNAQGEKSGTLTKGVLGMNLFGLLNSDMIHEELKRVAEINKPVEMPSEPA